MINYKDTFSRDEWDLGRTNRTEHSILTGDAASIKQAPKRVLMAHATQDRKAIDALKQKGVDGDNRPPWASSMLLVTKMDKGVRPCKKYHKINQLVKPDGFPLPRIQYYLDLLAGSSLARLITSVYFQIPAQSEDVPKTSFS